MEGIKKNSNGSSSVLKSGSIMQLAYRKVFFFVYGPLMVPTDHKPVF